MRVSASEKLELIRLVEGSSLSVRRTLAENRRAVRSGRAGLEVPVDPGGAAED